MEQTNNEITNVFLDWPKICEEKLSLDDFLAGSTEDLKRGDNDAV